MERQEIAKSIISVAKSLKSYQLADHKIAAFLYATVDAGQLGLFMSAIKSERSASLKRLELIAAQEGISPPRLIGEILPWLENAGLCQLTRDHEGHIVDCTSLLLAYSDLLNAVHEYYEMRTPTDEDRACLNILVLASWLPRTESALRHMTALQFTDNIATTALQLAKSYNIVASSGGSTDPLLYAPRVWANLHRRAPSALAALDPTQREVLTYLINTVRENQGYPESLLRIEATQHGTHHLVDLAIGIALMNRTELRLANGTTRSFLMTPHFYYDLRDEFGEDMCDRVKIFLDSIRNGQYFGSRSTGKILDPERLLRALIDRGSIGPATAIGQDYIVAEKAGIIRVTKSNYGSQAYMEIKQYDTVSKVLEIVATGNVEPVSSPLAASHISDGTLFTSIEQGRAELGRPSDEVAEIEHGIINRLREG